MTPREWAREMMVRFELAGAEASCEEVAEVIITKAVEQERERCASHNCAYCRDGVPRQFFKDYVPTGGTYAIRGWVHKSTAINADWESCRAAYLFAASTENSVQGVE